MINQPLLAIFLRMKLSGQIDLFTLFFAQDGWHKLIATHAHFMQNRLCIYLRADAPESSFPGQHVQQIVINQRSVNIQQHRLNHLALLSLHLFLNAPISSTSQSLCEGKCACPEAWPGSEQASCSAALSLRDG